MCICNSMIFHHQCSSAVFTFTERGDGSTFDYLPWMVTINKLKALHVGVKDPSDVWLVSVFQGRDSFGVA